MFVQKHLKKKLITADVSDHIRQFHYNHVFLFTVTTLHFHYNRRHVKKLVSACLQPRLQNACIILVHALSSTTITTTTSTTKSRAKNNEKTEAVKKLQKALSENMRISNIKSAHFRWKVAKIFHRHLMWKKKVWWHTPKKKPHYDAWLLSEIKRDKARLKKTLSSKKKPSCLHLNHKNTHYVNDRTDEKASGQKHNKS